MTCGRPSTAVMKSARRGEPAWPLRLLVRRGSSRHGYRNGRIHTRTPDDFRRHRRLQRRLGRHRANPTDLALGFTAFAGVDGRPRGTACRCRAARTYLTQAQTTKYEKRLKSLPFLKNK